MGVNDNWNWPTDWRQRFPMLTSIPVHVQHPSTYDIVVWKDKWGNDKKFSTTIAYDGRSKGGVS